MAESSTNSENRVSLSFCVSAILHHLSTIFMLGGSPSPPHTPQNQMKGGEMGLGTLPYDLLLNISTYLDLRDVHALHLVSGEP